MKYSLLINKARTIRAVRDNETGIIVKDDINPIEYAKLRKLAIINRNKRAENAMLKELCGTSARAAREDMGL
jgi:hypothetical protein